MPISIEAVTIETLPINIKTQTLPVLKIDIAAQTMGNININLVGGIHEAGLVCPIVNPDAEDDLLGWNIGYGTVDIWTLDRWTGTKSFRFPVQDYAWVSQANIKNARTDDIEEFSVMSYVLQIGPTLFFSVYYTDGTFDETNITPTEGSSWQKFNITTTPGKVITSVNFAADNVTSHALVDTIILRLKTQLYVGTAPTVNLNVDIKAQTVGNIAIDIAAQTVGNLNVNLAASAVTVQVNIASISGGVVFNVAQSGSWIVNAAQTGTWTINIGAPLSAAGNLKTAILESVQLNINIAASAVTLNVAIQSSAVTLNVNIESQTVDINIKTSGGANIIIDKLTQTAYTERRSTLSNDGGTIIWDQPLSQNRQGKFFPRGARGFIDSISAYCYDSGASGGTLTILISPHPNMGPIWTGSITIPAGGSAAWRSVDVRRMWNYDSLFVMFYLSQNQLSLACDASTPYDCFGSGDYGATWQGRSYRFFVRVVMHGETVGDVPFSGTVNTIEIPAASSQVESSTVAVPSGTLTSMLTVAGAGTLVEARIRYTATTAPTFDIEYRIYLYCDGVLAGWWSNRHLTQSETATAGRSSLGEFHQDSSHTWVTVRPPAKFRRTLELRALQYTGSEVPAVGYLAASKIA